MTGTAGATIIGVAAGGTATAMPFRPGTVLASSASWGALAIYVVAAAIVTLVIVIASSAGAVVRRPPRGDPG